MDPFAVRVISLAVLVFLAFNLIAARPSGGIVAAENPLAANGSSLINLRRLKRDFMFASGRNETDPECFNVSKLHILSRFGPGQA
jgi:hypothetical protein